MDKIAPTLPAASPFLLCVLILAAVATLRLIGLHFSVVDLYVDEAQYWVWSRELAWGYFSKPPLIAWIISAVTTVCGDGEACMRAASPLFYLGTGLLTYLIASDLYDARTGFWAALTVALAPAVAFSSRIISTDVPLLFFWALALLALLRLIRGGGLAWAVVLGVAIGFGLLAKYAMAYFLMAIALVYMIDADARDLLRRFHFWLALAIAAAMIAPNIIWNSRNEMATFRHTAGQVKANLLGLHPLEGLEFFAAQFAVIGPIVFGVLLVLIARFGSARLTRADRWMILFALPPLALMTGLAFVHGAYANWAATAFISAAIVASAVLVRENKWRWLYGNLALGIVVQLALLTGDVMADRITLALPGEKRDPYHRTLGWRALAEQTARLAHDIQAAAIIAENRYDIASLLYYLRDTKPLVLMWPTGRSAENYFETRNILSAAAPQPLLLVTACPFADPLRRYYGIVTPLGSFDAPTGPTTSRRYYAFKLSEPYDAIGPRGPCRAGPGPI